MRMRMGKTMKGTQKGKRMMNSISITKVISQSISYTCSGYQLEPLTTESSDIAALDAARSLLMLYNPDEDALTEISEHDPDTNATDINPIPIDEALSTLNALLKGGKKKSPQHPAQLAPLMIL
jgi:hypothetical protein